MSGYAGLVTVTVVVADLVPADAVMYAVPSCKPRTVTVVPLTDTVATLEFVERIVGTAVLGVMEYVMVSEEPVSMDIVSLDIDSAVMFAISGGGLSGVLTLVKKPLKSTLPSRSDSPSNSRKST
jgi:hypothetical protein